MNSLEKLIKVSTEYLLRKQVITEEDREIYEYGFHLIYNNIIDIASIVVISILLKQVPQTIVYHLSFILLRSVAGGYHAKTHWQCFIISTVMWLLSLWGIAYTTSAILCICVAALPVILVWAKAPIDHPNSPLGPSKYKRMKRWSRVLATALFIIIACVAFFAGPAYRWVAASLAYGMLSLFVLMVLALVIPPVATSPDKE